MECCLNYFGFQNDESMNKLLPSDIEDDTLPYAYSPSFPAENLQNIVEARGNGNRAFEQGDWKNAIIEYTRGLDCFDNANEFIIQNENTGTQNENSPIIILTLLLSNRAAAYLKTNAYDKALYDARGIIKYRPDWVKGYFRKGFLLLISGEALVGLRIFHASLEAYKMALSLDPGNPTIENRIEKARYYIEDESNDLEIHQLLPGREICHSSYLAPIQSLIFENGAKPMRNFIYLVANKSSRECILIDGCWDIDGILKYAKSQEYFRINSSLIIVAALITHYHVDHVGGIPPPPFDKYHIRVEGISKLLRKLPHIKAYAHELDIDSIIAANPEMNPSDFVPTNTGYEFTLPIAKDFNSPAWIPDKHIKQVETKIKFMHTPGHTNGSQCILVNENRLFTGDTLFIGTCGRVDFPDSCKCSMFNSLQSTLANLKPEVVVYPGHQYGGDFTTIGRERVEGFLRKMDEDQFVNLV
ncbi:hypothetical protein HDV01_000456 [Terramyces sp. JEL0728]|nr:hypothetical protein HDV01_000456 [Terramyces sp. JEL0728]